MRMRRRRPYYYGCCCSIVLLLWLAAAASPGATVCRSSDSNGDEDKTCLATEAGTAIVDQDPPHADAPFQEMVPEDCRAVLAPSALTTTAAGWGVFVLQDLERGQAVVPGDVVIQWPDLMSNTNTVDLGLRAALHNYFWSAEETGGFYEGARGVVSVLPGMGMTANGLCCQHHHLLPALRPVVDEAGLTRARSPLAGSHTHYHNYTFYLQRPVTAGQEIFVNYGPDWFAEREGKLQKPPNDGDDSRHPLLSRSVDWLRRHGRCLDHLRPASQSSVAGRGAVATRDLAPGRVVAPVPVLPLQRASLLSTNSTTTTTKPQYQLLLNYCLGHRDSSLLLYPYGPMVNLVNHGSGTRANVRLQWSKSKELYGGGEDAASVDPHWFENVSVPELLASRLRPDRAGLLLELVAVRPIRAGEEVLLDYGDDWSRALAQHVEDWEPVPGAQGYAPSYVFNDVIKVLRTERELRDHPYPDNIFTSCYYRYSDNKEEAEKQSDKGGGEGVTAFRWRTTRGIFEPRNLRPCVVLRRQDNADNGIATTAATTTTYTVRIRNRHGLSDEQRLPKGAVHIVTHVPRHAICFSDKSYTTDQHLANAFRKEIGIPDDIFPAKWKDLLKEE